MKHVTPACNTHCCWVQVTMLCETNQNLYSFRYVDLGMNDGRFCSGQHRCIVNSQTYTFVWLFQPLQCITHVSILYWMCSFRAMIPNLGIRIPTSTRKDCQCYVVTVILLSQGVMPISVLSSRNLYVGGCAGCHAASSLHTSCLAKLSIINGSKICFAS